MKKNLNENFTLQIGIATLKLILVSILIGLLHQFDFWIMLFLIVFMIIKFYPRFIKNFKENKVLLFGMISTGIIGITIEYWGVSNGYWTYHNLNDGRDFPYWLFFSWMLAFYFLYKLECMLIGLMKSKSIKAKLLLTITISMIFPVLGEIITINLGVWTYYFPMQFFGVPLYAILGLITVHMIINFLLVFICKKYQIQDPIFSLGYLKT